MEYLVASTKLDLKLGKANSFGNILGKEILYNENAELLKELKKGREDQT